MASGERVVAHEYEAVWAADEQPLDRRRLLEQPAATSRPCALSALLLANGLLCVVLTAALLYLLLPLRSPVARDSAPSAGTAAAAHFASSTSPPLSPSSSAVDATLLSLGIPVSGSPSLSSRTSLLTVVLMNRTGTRFEQPAKQGTFVSTNTADAAAALSPAAFHSALLAYYHSLCQQRLNALVLHDIHPAHAAEYYAQFEQQRYSFLGQSYVCNVTFVYAPPLLSARLYSSLHPYDLRWLLYERYLALHGAGLDWLLFSDVSDVTFERNPFDFMLRQWVEDARHPTVYIGRDPLVIEQHDFCKMRYAACELAYAAFADRMAVNAGVLGGWVAHCQWLLAALSRYYEQLVQDNSTASLQCRQLGADMAVLNRLLLDPTTENAPLQAAPRPLPFVWYAEESGLVGGAFTGPFAFRRSAPNRQYIRHKTAWEGQQPQEWEHHLRNDSNTKSHCPLLAD